MAQSDIRWLSDHERCCCTPPRLHARATAPLSNSEYPKSVFAANPNIQAENASKKSKLSVYQRGHCTHKSEPYNDVLVTLQNLCRFNPDNKPKMLRDGVMQALISLCSSADASILTEVVEGETYIMAKNKKGFEERTLGSRAKRIPHGKTNAFSDAIIESNFSCSVRYSRYS